MYWRFGTYANVSTLNTVLEKADASVEEVLDDGDVLSELKSSNSKLIDFLREEHVLRKLLDLVVAPAEPKPAEDDHDSTADESSEEQPVGRIKSLSPFRRKRGKTQRQEEVEEWEKRDKERAKNAYTASEILSSETWSILDSLLEIEGLMAKFWELIRQDRPLDTTQAAYFTKINENLLEKKTARMVVFLQSLDGIVSAMLRHIDCAAIMDLLLKLISMDKSTGGENVVDWLQSQNLIPQLLAFLRENTPPGTQTAAGDFLKAIVTISANASQNEQSCIGPNNLTRQLVSQTCIEELLQHMLRGGNSLTVGVGLVIEIIRKNNSDYDPDVSTAPETLPTSSDPIYLGTMLRCFAKKVPDFMRLLLSPTHSVSQGEREVTIVRKQLGVAFGRKIEPLGFDRFKTCELMAELLHCSNMSLLNESGSEAYIRQRDEEREKHRAQDQARSLEEETSSWSEEPRKLEIANSGASDDGFEDISTPPVPPAIRPRLDLDEEFVEEPLYSSSPTSVAMPEPLRPRTSSTDVSIEDLTQSLDRLAPPAEMTTSPHPEDRPAPLFAQDVVETRDDSPLKISADFEYDLDGQPVVGDFLKIMFVEHRVIPTILVSHIHCNSGTNLQDFFFRFPWNNFLHNVVYDVIQQVFNGPIDRGFNRSLAIDCFTTGRIVERIIEGQEENDRLQAQNGMRLGYMGHLTLVAEEVVKFSDRVPPELISPLVLEKVTSSAWNDYVEQTLSETREKDNAILGGVRPDVSLGPRQTVLNAVNAAGGVSVALANAGLHGNTGSETSHNTTASGFANSSDDDEEDDELDIHEEEAPTVEPLGPAFGSDGEASQPPPLNLPPSRARRQLAARLALHNVQDEEEDEGKRQELLLSEAQQTLLSPAEDDSIQPKTTLPRRFNLDDFVHSPAPDAQFISLPEGEDAATVIKEDV